MESAAIRKQVVRMIVHDVMTLFTGILIGVAFGAGVAAVVFEVLAAGR